MDDFIKIKKALPGPSLGDGFNVTNVTRGHLLELQGFDLDALRKDGTIVSYPEDLQPVTAKAIKESNN